MWETARKEREYTIANACQWHHNTSVRPSPRVQLGKDGRLLSIPG